MSEEQQATPLTAEISEEALVQVQGGAPELEAHELQTMINKATHQTGVSTLAHSVQAGTTAAIGFGATYVGQVIGKGGQTHKS